MNDYYFLCLIETKMCQKLYITVLLSKCFKMDQVNQVGPECGDDDHVCEYILRKYELIQKLGHSPFGVVWRAVDKNSRNPVALKKVYDGFSTPKRAQMMYRELMVLEKLQGHEHVVELRNVLMDADQAPGDLYLVMSLMDTDLYSAIRAKVLDEKHHPYIIAQIVRGLGHLHALGFVHRDLKPSNVLVDGKCNVKLCDFGHARSLLGVDERISHNNEAGSNTSDYLGSRWYRAPEVLLGTKRVSMAVDMWGLGCILGEMLLNEPIFQGTSSTNQLELIIQLTGYPDESEIDSVQAPYAREQLEPGVIGNIVPKAMNNVFENATAEALDFLRLCLQFDPSLRISARESLKHPYVIEFYQELFELDFDSCKVETLFLDDNIEHSVKEYRHVILENVQNRINLQRKQLGKKGTSFQ